MIAARAQSIPGPCQSNMTRPSSTDSWTPNIVVGLDLKDRHKGALAWLYALQSLAPNRAEIRAVHALSGWQSQILGSVLGSEKSQERVHAKLLAQCEAAAPGLCNSVELLPDQELPESLEFYAQRHHADLLVLGRVAPKEPTPFVRLGSVARGILQSLMLPTLVVPSDYEAQDFGPGPVMVAVDGSATSNEALRFATRWASHLGRELFLAHVLPNDTFLGQSWLADKELREARALLLTRSREALDAWLKQDGHQAHRIELVQGNTFQELRKLGQAQDACMVVTGSRCLDANERIFSTSMSSALAASCDRPVAVVPSTPWKEPPGHAG